MLKQMVRFEFHQNIINLLLLQIIKEVAIVILTLLKIESQHLKGIITQLRNRNLNKITLSKLRISRLKLKVNTTSKE